MRQFNFCALNLRLITEEIFVRFFNCHTFVHCLRSYPKYIDEPKIERLKDLGIVMGIHSYLHRYLLVLIWRMFKIVNKIICMWKEPSFIANIAEMQVYHNTSNTDIVGHKFCHFLSTGVGHLLSHSGNIVWHGPQSVLDFGWIIVYLYLHRCMYAHMYTYACYVLICACIVGIRWVKGECDVWDNTKFWLFFNSKVAYNL